MALTREDRTIVAAAATHHGRALELRGASGTTVLKLPRLALLSGRVRVMAVLFDGAGVHRWDERFASGALEVLAGTQEVGLVRLDHEWRDGQRPDDGARSSEREVAA